MRILSPHENFLQAFLKSDKGAMTAHLSYRRNMPIAKSMSLQSVGIIANGRQTRTFQARVGMLERLRQWERASNAMKEDAMIRGRESRRTVTLPPRPGCSLTPRAPLQAAQPPKKVASVMKYEDESPPHLNRTAAEVKEAGGKRMYL